MNTDLSGSATLLFAIFRLCRLRNVILALAGNGTLLWDTSIMYGWEASTKYAVTELLSPDSMKDVALLTQQRMLMDIQ